MMFETAEVGNRTDKATYDAHVPELRTALLQAQRNLAESDAAVVILIGGAEGAGKEATVGLLLNWLDTRGVETHAMWDETDEERERPPLWRFWRVLPPKGKMAILFGSWYTQPIIDRVYGKLKGSQLEREMRRIRDFEQMLTNEGTTVLKFWMHLAKPIQAKRLEKLKADPRTRWRVRKSTFQFFKRYDDFRRVSEKCLRLTSTGFAPWHVVEATNNRFRNLTVTTTVLSALREAVSGSTATAEPATVPVAGAAMQGVNVLQRLDLGVTLPEDTYRKRLAKYQARLSKLTRRLHDAGRSLILVFEGTDASGKGGAIRRITSAVDPRLWRVMSVAAPTDEEAARPYLWRFWRSLPRRGHVTVYDRSWYGRVLVERVEGFCRPGDWRRAYGEINEFEEQLTEFGTVIVKFWLATSPEEQLRRFQDRQTTPYKQYKLTEEDWRNREKWDAYENAACDMIERTSTERAPWVLVEANDKYWARIKVIRSVCRHLGRQ